MEEILNNQWLWTAALGLCLYLPTRKLIWVMSVRRAERLYGPTDEEKQLALRKRAGITAALLVFIFAVLYMHVLFQAPKP